MIKYDIKFLWFLVSDSFDRMIYFQQLYMHNANIFRYNSVRTNFWFSFRTSCYRPVLYKFKKNVGSNKSEIRVHCLTADVTILSTYIYR